MSSTINRNPLANVNTNVDTRTDGTRQSARGNAGNMTKANSKQHTVEPTLKKSIYCFFDDLFKNQLHEEAPCTLTSKKLFPSLRTDQIPVEQLSKRRRDIASLFKRAVPGITKLACPEDPNSVLKNLRDLLLEHLSVNQRSNTEIEREHKEELAALHKKLDAMTKINQRIERIEKESQLDKDNIRYYEALSRMLKRRKRCGTLGRKVCQSKNFVVDSQRMKKFSFSRCSGGRSEAKAQQSQISRHSWSLKQMELKSITRRKRCSTKQNLEQGFLRSR